MLIFKLFLAFSGVVFSAFFSGAETGLYTVSLVKLKLYAKKSQKKYTLLRDLLKDRQSLVFTTLVGTNISNFVATSVVTGIFITYFNLKDNSELYTTAFLTPIMFIFAEVLPKNIFYTNADVLMPPSSKFLWFFNKVLTYSGIVPLLKLFTKLAEKMTGLVMTTENLINTTQKHQVMELIHQTHEEGLLDGVQTSLIEKFTYLSQQRCDFIANPASKFAQVNIKSTKKELIEKLEDFDQSFWLVYKGSRGDIVGYIDIAKTLKSEIDFCDLTEQVITLKEIPAEQKIIDSISDIYSEKIAALTYNKRITGIVTINDIVEEISLGLKNYTTR